MKKAFKWKSGEGYTVKRKARKKHVCSICEETINVNDEYYLAQYTTHYERVKLCESCWSGQKLSAKNTRTYGYNPDPDKGIIKNFLEEHESDEWSSDMYQRYKRIDDEWG